ncbi:MAG: inorganic diphosphatase [Chloroflexota bacterium]
MEALESIDAMVEIPRGGRNKYEYDEKNCVLRLDRVLYSSVHYPVDYGFIPGTRAPDGDHLDVMIVVEEPTFPGCVMSVRPIGMLRMLDEKGEDYKILAVPTRDPRFEHIRELPDLPSHWLREIENFFQTYKYLEGVPTEVLGWEGKEKARQTIAAYTVQKGK